MKYSKVAMFSDIHFGRQNNNEVHNQDCIRYIEWFCGEVKKQQDIDCIFFLGDWHEHRSAINGLTLHYSRMGASMLDQLNIPIYFVVGNHDLYYRNNRDIFTVEIFDILENITVVDKPITINDGTCVITPFLFEEEYSKFFETYSTCNVIAGHFEFKGFVLTGETVVKETGPDPSGYINHRKIFSGHYHRRQNKDNVHYIGNTFPADFGDANDSKRGMAVYDFDTDLLNYIDWPKCPRYIKTTLSELLINHKKVLRDDDRVRVLVDQSITLSENNEIKKYFTDNYRLREITMEEQLEPMTELSDIEKEVESLKLEGVNQIVPELIKRISSEKIDSNKLVEIYRSL